MTKIKRKSELLVFLQFYLLREKFTPTKNFGGVNQDYALVSTPIKTKILDPPLKMDYCPSDLKVTEEIRPAYELHEYMSVPKIRKCKQEKRTQTDR